jgi:uncharacterized alkaline shock family protein YloU
MDRQILKIHDHKDVGEIHIADEVIAIIAGLAATEVEGVKGMVGNLAGDIVELLGRKNLAKGVIVEVGEGTVSLTLSIVVTFGSQIVEVSKAVSEKVKNAVETMTGLEVEEVNINVTGVDIEK